MTTALKIFHAIALFSGGFVLAGCVRNGPSNGVPANSSASYVGPQTPTSPYPQNQIIMPGQYNPRTSTIQHSYVNQYTAPTPPPPVYTPPRR